jgi:hypothetical protein
MKEKNFELSVVIDHIFMTLKATLTSAPILKNFDLRLPVVIENVISDF